MPPAGVIVTDEGVTVVMDVPGLRSENLEIELENDTLSARGEQPHAYGDDGDQQQRVGRRIERSFGRFERSLRVPAGLSPDQVQAPLTDGVLTISAPRPQPPQPNGVQIEAGGAQEQQSQEQESQETTPA